MLKFGFVGGVDPRVVIRRPVRFGDVRAYGISASSDDRRRAPHHAEDKNSLYIDIWRDGEPRCLRKSWTFGDCVYSTPAVVPNSA